MKLTQRQRKPDTRHDSRDQLGRSASDDAAPQPQPERTEPTKADPGLSDLSKHDYLAIIRRAGRETVDDNVPMIASALAYSAFLAIPSTLLVATGLFTLVAGPDTISNLMQRLNDHPATSIAMTIVGFLIALWATTGAMNAFITGLNIAYDRKDSRNFVKKRIVALQMTACMIVAFLLVFGLLVLGPVLSKWVGNAVGASGVVSAIWWAAQWPVLLVGLLAAFATLLYLGPDVDQPKWRFVTPGALLAVVAWLTAFRRLHLAVQLLQQDLGLACGSDHHADLALADRTRPALRSRVERRGRTQPRTQTRQTRRSRTPSTCEVLTQGACVTRRLTDPSLQESSEADLSRWLGWSSPANHPPRSSGRVTTMISSAANVRRASSIAFTGSESPTLALTLLVTGCSAFIPARRLGPAFVVQWCDLFAES